jgi:Putative zinc-finger
MSPTLKPPDPHECELVGELISWHANGTLGPADRALVDAHTAMCDTCRTTLAVERRLVDGMRAPRGNVEQSPHAGWQKLVARLDAEEAAMALREREAPKTEPSAKSVGALAGTSSNARDASGARPARSRVNWPAALGAAVAVQAAAIAVLAVALVRHRQTEGEPRFHTVANADPTLAASGPLVRIAFDPSVDEKSARAVAAQAGAQRILAGPSPDNVYTFEFRDDAAAEGALDRKVSELRRQAHVLLVEPVVVGYPRAEK